MPNTRNFNRSFAGGEISPEMFGRIDADKYQTGAAKMLNMIAKPQGPAQNRPGFQYVGAVKNSAHKSRLIRFVYSVDDSVVVELGEQYIRFYKNGGPIQVSTLPALQRNTVTFVNTLTTILWIGHQLVAGDRIKFATSAAGFIAGTTYYVVSPSTNVIQLSLSEGGSAIAANANTTATAGKVYVLSDTVSYSGYNYYAKGEVNSAVAVPTAGGSPASSTEWHYMPGSFYEIPSPYSAVNIFDITYTQSNDVMTFTHPSYSIRELRRYAETDWELVGVNLEASLVAPSTVVGYGKHSGRIKISTLEAAQYNTLNGSDVLKVLFTGSASIALGDLVYISGTGVQKFDNRLFTVRERVENSGLTYAELS